MLTTRRAGRSAHRALPAAALLAFAACGEDRSLEPHAHAVRTFVIDTLVTRGVCASLPQCRTGDFVFWDPGPRAVELQVYGVRSEGTVAAMRAACARYVATTAGAPPIHLRVYDETKRQTLRGPFLGPEPKWQVTCEPAVP